MLCDNDTNEDISEFDKRAPVRLPNRYADEKDVKPLSSADKEPKKNGPIAEWFWCRQCAMPDEREKQRMS